MPTNTPVQLIGDQAIFGDIGVAQLALHNDRAAVLIDSEGSSRQSR